MTPFRIVLLMIAAVSVSACAGPQTASRNATFNETATSTAPIVQKAVQTAQSVYIPNAKITNVTVTVPQELTVSEKNSYFPKADIVWRGDMIGNRHEQVRAIVAASAANAAQNVGGSIPVNVEITVTRFHGLTEKARYTTGGVHNMNFLITLRDPATGQVLRGPREVITNLDAFGGSDAIAADSRGETQKARVTAFLSEVIRTELTNPAGYQDTNSGFFVTLNAS
jgi:hypothetical protein